PKTVRANMLTNDAEMTSSTLVKKFSYPLPTLTLHLKSRDPLRNFNRSLSGLTPSSKSYPPPHTNSSCLMTFKSTLFSTSPCSSGTRPHHRNSLGKSHFHLFPSISQSKTNLNMRSKPSS